MLEVQTRELPIKVPSSASEPRPVNVIIIPSIYVLPSDGLVMLAVGGVFSAAKTNELPVKFPLKIDSVTRAMK
jgi:hypothetical protein